MPELLYCNRCVMDGSDPDIVLDKNGVCNHCHQALKLLREVNQEAEKLPLIIRKIKHDGKKNEFDCVIGLSGGVDSSTVLHEAVCLGLRPFCFSIDNGYNDSRTDENILRLVETLRVPFYRYTIDLKKFMELQSAFINAGLINIEIPTDHILMAASYEMAAKYGIKWILSGGNVATESVMPPAWSYTARDLTHIKDVYKKMTGKGLTGLPFCGLVKWNYYKWIKGIKTLYLLDFINYNRKESEKMLIEKYGFQSTGEKHEESIFTKWFQNFYLYEKFGIDKRKAHYSSLILSGQMTRSQAKERLLETLEYPELGIERQVLRYPKHKHTDFKTDKWFDRISKFIKIWKY